MEPVITLLVSYMKEKTFTNEPSVKGRLVNAETGEERRKSGSVGENRLCHPLVRRGCGAPA